MTERENHVNPNTFPIHIAVPGAPSMRSVCTEHVTFTEQQAYQLLSDSNLNTILETHRSIDKKPILHETVLELNQGTNYERDGKVIELFPSTNFIPSTVATMAVDRFANNLMEMAQEVAISPIHDQGRRDEELIALFYDVGVGMQLLSRLVQALEALKFATSLQDTTLLDRYRDNPLEVIEEAVRVHIARFTRNYPNYREEVGEYVPEFLAAGLRHGSTIFTKAYTALSEHGER